MKRQRRFLPASRSQTRQPPYEFIQMSLDYLRMWKRYLDACAAVGNAGFSSRLPVGPKATNRDYLNSFLGKLNRFPVPRSARHIVDVGANVGVCTQASALYCPDATIIAFEPSAPTFERLEKLAGSRIICRKAAVGAASGTATLHIAENAFSSTLRAPSESCKNLYGNAVNPTGATEEVPVVTLAQIITEYRLPQIDLLKVDVEGFEPQVLAGAGDFLVSHVHRIMLEASLARLTFGGVLEMLQSLERLGFVLVGLDDVSRASHLPNGPVAQFDVYLINPSVG